MMRRKIRVHEIQFQRQLARSRRRCRLARKRLNFDDSAWKTVSTPYAWNEDDAFKVSIDELRTGIAWYRKKFQLPAGSARKKVFLEFEGIRQGGDFYLNGEFIGRSENGVMAFGFDITDKVKPAPQQNMSSRRKLITPGIITKKRPARLFSGTTAISTRIMAASTKTFTCTLPTNFIKRCRWVPTLGTTGVYVYAQNFDIAGKSATISAESQVKNEAAQPRTFHYQVVIEDMSGKVVATIDGGNTVL